MKKKVEEISWQYPSLSRKEAKEIMHHFISKSCTEFKLPQSETYYINQFEYDEDYFEEIFTRIKNVLEECHEDYLRPDNDEGDKEDYCFRYLQAEIMLNHLKLDVSDILISDLVKLTFFLSKEEPPNCAPITYGIGTTALDLYYFKDWTHEMGKIKNFKIPSLIAEHPVSNQDYDWDRIHKILSNNN